LKKEVRQKSKGIGANVDGEMRKQKYELGASIDEIDRKAERQELNSGEWKYRYKLERDLEEILAFEEKIWQQRCSARWVLEGDANTKKIHGIANGRRQKCSIFSLEVVGGEISDPVELRRHIEGYNKMLFASEERGVMRLHEDMWRDSGSLSTEEAERLIKSFSELEIKEALDEMNPNSALGPDGLNAAFYKSFWDKVKDTVIEMFENFCEGKLNLSRLNYGMISLIPKLKEANNIK
jgi:hypothetical protein